jgi:hypothetical protein
MPIKTENSLVNAIVVLFVLLLAIFVMVYLRTKSQLLMEENLKMKKYKSPPDLNVGKA